MAQDENAIVNVLFDFDYTTEEGRIVCIREGEELLVIKKTNEDWWQVIREGDARPFYAPKTYLSEIANEGNNDINANIKALSETVLFIANPLYSEFPIQPAIVNDRKNDNFEEANTEDVPEGVTVIHIPGPTLLCNQILKQQQGESCLDDDSLSEDTKVDNTDEDYDELESNDDDGTKSTDSAYNDRLQKVLEDDGDPSLEEEVNFGPESPIYANFPLLSSLSPPVPQPGDAPQKALFNYWAEYVDDSGRRYYYNTKSKETTWKPPRKGIDILTDHPENSFKPDAPPTPPQQPKPKLVRASQIDGESFSSSTDSLDLSELSPCTPPKTFNPICGEKGLPSLSPPSTPTLSKGWSQEINKDTGEVSYLHSFTNEKWFSSLDDSGRIYYYPENSNESHWELPEVPVDTLTQSTSQSLITSKGKGAPPRPKGLNLPSRKQKTTSWVMVDHCNLSLTTGDDHVKSSSLPRDMHVPQWPSLQDGSLNVLRQGVLNKTRLVESGKRLKKHWSSSYLVLTDLFLLCYKDIKAAQGVNGGTKPDICFDLGGAIIGPCTEKSSRKNVFQLQNVLGQQILLHDDNSKTSKEWYSAIEEAIKKLPTSTPTTHWMTEKEQPLKDKSKRSTKLPRTKSTKQTLNQRDTVAKGETALATSSSMVTPGLASLPSPTEESCNSTERKKRIRDKLRNFFLRRPSMESLREKGILKDEPVFGCHLHNLCAREKSNIPKFVTSCIEAIEKRDMSADGLYRASGNLSQVQKIRFQVNQDDYSGLKSEEDVHVLTGALKMFFRDMKEPLFPFDTFDSFLKAISLFDRQKRINTLTDLVKRLPKPNYETLKYLMHHLYKVTQLCDRNRMHVQNIAIVFGPTLMWRENESTDLAVDMMHQNQIMELLLLEFGSIFVR